MPFLFFSLGFGARYLRLLLARLAAWRVLDAAIAVIMGSIALQSRVDRLRGSGSDMGERS